MPLLIAIGISLFHMNKQLEKSNAIEYEVSLVGALKNSATRGIEEIEILNPSYSSFLQTHGELMSKLHLLMGLQSNTN